MSQSVRKILKNSVLQTLNVYVTTAVNFLLILVYTRQLSPENFGLMFTAQAQVLLLVMFVDLGLYGGLISALTYAENDKEDVSRQGFRAWDLVWRVLGIRLLGATLGAIIISSVAYFHAHADGAWNQERFLLDIAFIPHLYALACYQTLVPYLNFHGRLLLGVIANIIGVIASAALSVYFAWQGESLAVLLVSQSWGGFLAAAIVLVGLWWRPMRSQPSRRSQRKRRGNWQKEAWNALFKDAWPYALIFAASVLWQRLDQLTASHFLGYEEGAQYALAVRLMVIPMMVANAVYIAIVPDLQRVGRDAPEKLIVYLGAVGKTLFRFGLPLSVLLLSLIYWLMIPLFPKYEGARSILFWFAPGIWGYWLQNFIIATLYGFRAFKQVVWVHFFAILVYLVALALAPKFGIKGIVWSYDIFCIVLFVFALRALHVLGHLPKGFSLLRAYSPAERAFLSLVFQRLKPFWRRIGA